MVTNKGVCGTASSMPAGIAFGCGIGVFITVIGAMVSAKMIDGGMLAETAIGYSSMVILLVASYFGSCTAFLKTKRRRLFSCLICGGVYFGMLLVATALFFGGQYRGIGVTALLIAAGSGCAALIGFPKRKQNHVLKRKNGYR